MTMYQIDKIMKKENINLKFATIAKYEDKYFLTALKLNALFVYDQKTKKLTYLDSFDINWGYYCMYIRSFLYKDEIWFVPGEAEKVAILHTHNMQIEYIPIHFGEKYCISKLKYNNFVIFNDYYVCFIPRSISEAVIINMETKKVEKYYEIAKQNEEFQNAILVDNMLLFYPWHGQRKVFLDLMSGELNDEQWYGNESFGDAVYDEVSEKIFHAPALENYVLVDDVHGKISETKILNFPTNDAGYHTFYSSLCNGEILFWGMKGVISINSKKHYIHYSQIREDTDGVILFPIDSSSKEAFVYEGNKIWKYDDSKERYIAIEISIKFEDFLNQIEKAGRCIHDLYEHMKYYCEEENNPWTLKEYIYMINQYSSSAHLQNSLKGHQSLRKEVDYSKIFSI